MRTVAHGGKRVRTAIGKSPVATRIAIETLGCAGDAQADHRYHGGPDRAVYAYAAEDYAWWAAQLDRELAPGLFGENLTLRGIDVSHARIGERWRVGTAVLQVTSPRVPCAKLAMVMGDPAFVKTFGAALRPGAYLRIISDGAVAAGDEVEILARPSHELTLAAMTRIMLFDHARIPDALAVPELPAYLRDWALAHQP